MIFETKFAGTFITIRGGKFLKEVRRIQCAAGVTVAFVIFNNDDKQYRVSIKENIGLKYSRRNPNPFATGTPAQEVRPNAVDLMIAKLKDGYKVDSGADHDALQMDPNLITYGVYKYTLVLEADGRVISELDPDLEVDDPMSNPRP